MKKYIALLLSCIMLISSASAQQPAYKKIPMWDTSLSFERRVSDLVGRLSLEEKVGQMMNHAPAIERLGIPAYDWWNEVLHGVARTPYRVTVYPQAIGMAATFDTNSLKTMADFSAMEGRAVYNKAMADGRSGERYVGLTYWTPNINIFRDPRWGRGQETYGEDPFLTAMMGKAFVHGLQGDDSKYLKAAACAKHYAVHSGPEPERHVFNAEVSNYDLWNTYLPAFKELVTKANVAGVMCAYNAFRTQPCCGSDILMNDILRNQWKFTGYVTSDCWAIDDFFKNHKTHPDAATASADAVMHGTDVDCGTAAFLSLVEAVKSGLIKEEQIDVSVKRLFMIRYRLGMFDPAAMVKYANVSAAELESPAHKAHALKMAQQSIVLLKNDDRTLPLKKTIKKIAVFGPNAHNSIAILGNYNGNPTKTTTLLQGIQNKLGSNVEIIYEKLTNYTNDTMLQYQDLSKQFTVNGIQGFNAEYFNNIKLEGQPVTSIEKTLDHFWQEGESVTGNIKANNFSARYSTTYTADQTGEITFELEADDGYRMFIDEKEVINAWQRNRWGAQTYRLATEKNKSYNLRIEYWQGDGKANIKLQAGQFRKNDISSLMERLKDVDAIIFAGGISPQLEGEEMKVDYPGFNGGDRTSIALPAVQTDYMKQLKTLGKPVVFVLMTGSAVAFPWEAENLPAIVNGWYGGQAAGEAMADVIFGDYNPGGRLPVTFYSSDKDLPDFDNYDMKGRTYRYFDGKPLYPFGYGLSYSTFKYENLSVQPSVAKSKGYSVTATITNTSKLDGEEVVQLYVSGKVKNLESPIRALKDFQRIALRAGESKTIHLSLSADDLSIIDDDGKAVLMQGEVEISIGGGQPNVAISTTSNVLTKKIEMK